MCALRILLFINAFFAKQTPALHETEGCLFFEITPHQFTLTSVSKGREMKTRKNGNGQCKQKKLSVAFTKHKPQEVKIWMRFWTRTDPHFL